MRYERIKKYAQLFCFFICLYLYFKNSQVIISSVKGGLLLCYNVVIPSLFVFMVICSIISNLSCCELLAIPFMPYFRLLHINDKRAVSYCVLAVMGGFATGGIMLDKLHSEFDCDKNTLGILSILMSGNSPSFIILAVGAHYIGNAYVGMIIYFSILISAFISAFFMSFIYKTGINCASNNRLVTTNNIVSSIKSSVTSILNICGVVTLTFCLCKVFSVYTDKIFILLIFSAFTEVSAACEIIFENFSTNLYLLSLILLVFPVSANLQMKSIGNNNTLNFKILFISKFIQIPISLLILRTLLNLFPQVVNVYANGDISVNAYWNKPQVSFFLVVIALCFALLFDKKTEVFTNRQK